MPVPYENPPSPLPTVAGRHNRTIPQEWALDQVRFHHNEALFWLGEYSIFVLLWHIEDHAGGLVDRCPTCWQDDAVADVYNQPRERKCPDCLGTTFDGGYKALLYRPGIWDMTEPSHEEARRGEVERQTASVQTTSDFRIRKGDWGLRGDGTRWRMESVSTNRLRTGFEPTTAKRGAVGFNLAQVHLVDQDSPAHLVEPTDEAMLIDRLNIEHLHWPVDFSEHEVIRGPLY